MSYFLRCLALAALPAFGQTAGIAPVAIFTDFQHSPSPVVSDSIRQEVENILAPLGLPLQWKSLAGLRGDEMAIALAVVTFHGNCTTADLINPSDKRSPLGITHISGGVVIPFTEVECDRVRAFLRKDLQRTLSEKRDAVFGRAVGRVLAHELFHIFVGTTHHSSGGVAEPFFTESELMAGEFQFESSEMRLLRASLKQARQQYARSRSAASPLAGRSIFQEEGCASCHGAQGQGSGSAPAIRIAGSRPLEPKALATKLAKSFTTMYSHARNRRLKAPALDDEEIADVVSFLSELE